MRRSIVAKCDIDKSVKITDEMIALKRPSTGISSIYVDEIIGKKTLKKIFKDEMFKWSDLER